MTRRPRITRHIGPTIALSIGLLLIASSIIANADNLVPPATNASTTRPAQTPRRHFSLDLPDLGSPRSPSKIGGCRTPGENLLVAALSPGEPGLTTNPSPTLYWYLSNATPHPIELTLTPVGNVDPILDLTFDGTNLHGLQSIDLAKHGIHLDAPPADAIDPVSATGKVLTERRPLYEWVVAVIRDPGRRSRDVIGVGFIERALPSAQLHHDLNQAGDDQPERAAIFAHSNLWYDALSEINHSIDQYPVSFDLRQARANLLSQVGLSLDLDSPPDVTTHIPVGIKSATSTTSGGPNDLR